MKLFCVTMTGADDRTDPKDLARLSQAFPFVEWGILLSKGRAGQPRYPSADWIASLARVQDIDHPFNPSPAPMRLSAHLCGATMRDFLSGITFSGYDEGAWVAPHGLDESRFNRLFDRAQVNVNITREKLDDSQLRAMLAGWCESMDGALITQHNQANANAWSVLQEQDFSLGGVVRAHQILHDASGGRGLSPATWAPPIAGMLNGYAGGIGAHNAVETLEHLSEIVGDGYIWIDMENALRDADDRFDIRAIEDLLQSLEQEGVARGWL